MCGQLDVAKHPVAFEVYGAFHVRGNVMKKFEYLADRTVVGFLEWGADLVGGRRQLNGRWHSPQGSGFTFRCESLREACEKYQWPTVGASKRFYETAEAVRRVAGSHGEPSFVVVVVPQGAQFVP